MSDAEDSTRTAAPSAHTEPPALDPAKRFFLVVDDVAPVRNSVKRNLEPNLSEHGVELLLVETGAEAIRLLQSESGKQIVGVLTDLDGTSEGEAVARAASAKNIPVTVFSGGVNLRNAELPADAVRLEKPYNTAALIAWAIKCVLDAQVQTKNP